jgi:F-type H+-transporting ATPase subunit a
MEHGIHISLRAEEMFHIGGLPVTNGLFLAVMVVGFLSVAAIIFRRRLALVPNAAQNAVEFVFEQILGIMDNALGERRESEKYFPLIATIFLFILASNWSGLLPGIGSIVMRGDETTPLLRSPASDLNFTVALAVIAVIAVNLLGTVAIGAASHVKKFINFKSPVGFFIGILELISEIARIISFSFRLFGNIFAGEVLLTVVAFLIPYIVPLPFLFLETFVGFIQAFIFAMLALVFIAIAIKEHH